MILDKIAEATVKRVEKAKERQIIEILQEKIYFGASLKRFNNRSPFSFEKALRSYRTENTTTEIGRSNMHFI